MKHHIVQKAYLRQWANNGQLNIFSILENKILERGPNWFGFWVEDYNVFEGESGYDYAPENVTAHIDAEGLRVIKNFEFNPLYLDGYKKSCLAFYFALQYLRTPRRRVEANKLATATFNNLYKDNFLKSIEEDLDISKLIEEEDNIFVKEKLKAEIKGKTIEKIKSEIIELVKENNMQLEISNPGHSKQMMRLLDISEKLFYYKWTFLVAPKGTSFITSDSPCFISSDKEFLSGILSIGTKSYFPLRPDLCLLIESVPQKNNKEYKLVLSKNDVKEINRLVIKNSYANIIAKDSLHLKSLVSGYDFSSHKNSNDIKIYRDGDYIIFNAE